MPIDYKKPLRSCNMIKSGIYKIENPKGKIYVGQSVNVGNRIRQYLKLKNCQDQRLLFNSIQKYGIALHKFEILEYCEIQLLNGREEYFMRLYNCQNRGTGLNIRSAGSVGKHSIETRLRMSQAKIGKRMSTKARKNMSLAKKKNPTRFWLGKKRSRIDLNKFRESHLGLVNSNKPIVAYDKNRNIIGRYDGATDAARKLSITRTAIKNNLRGYSKTCNGKVFKYVPDKL